MIFVQKNICSVSANRNPGMCLQMCVPKQIPRSAEQRPCQRIEFWIDPFCVARVSFNFYWETTETKSRKITKIVFWERNRVIYGDKIKAKNTEYLRRRYFQYFAN